MKKLCFLFFTSFLWLNIASAESSVDLQGEWTTGCTMLYKDNYYYIRTLAFFKNKYIFYHTVYSDSDCKSSQKRDYWEIWKPTIETVPSLGPNFLQMTSTHIRNKTFLKTYKHGKYEPSCKKKEVHIILRKNNSLYFGNKYSQDPNFKKRLGCKERATEFHQKPDYVFSRLITESEKDYFKSLNVPRE